MSLGPEGHLASGDSNRGVSGQTGQGGNEVLLSGGKIMLTSPEGSPLPASLHNPVPVHTCPETQRPGGRQVGEEGPWREITGEGVETRTWALECQAQAVRDSWR